jgi:hypothetical protein
MASVTKEIREEAGKGKTNLQAGSKEEGEPSRVEPDGTEPVETEQGADDPDWLDSEESPMTQAALTQEKWDNGNDQRMSQGGSAELTGKLCWHVMALIHWKVGTDRAVMVYVVQVLEEWLHRRGISIYTDLV